MTPKHTPLPPADRDVGALGVAIVSLDARFARELAAALTARALSASTFTAATLIETACSPQVIAFDAGTVPLDALIQCRLRFDRARSLVLGPGEPRLVIEGFAAGVDAWMLRSEPLDIIASGVCLLALGGTGISRAVLQLLLSLAITDGNHAGELSERVRLSPRQFEVLTMAARGLTDQEIADQLVLSVRTVNRHMSDILAILHCSNRNEASRFLLGQMPQADGSRGPQDAV